MDLEIECIEKNETWELVDVPKYKDVISVKWIYKTNKDVDGNVQKHKARMVAIGFKQHPGIDFNENFAPVQHMNTVRKILAIATQKNGMFIKWMLSRHF